MADVIHTANVTGSNSITAGDNYFLGQGVSHVGTIASAINITGAGDNDLFINGDLVQLSSTTAIFGSQFSTEGVNIHVGQNGSIMGSSNFRAIQLSASLVTVSNAGLITGGETIRLQGANSEIINSGAIQGTFTTSTAPVYAIVYAGSNARLFNSGTIESRHGIISSGNIDVANTGVITTSEITLRIDNASVNVSYITNTGTMVSTSGDVIRTSSAAGVEVVTNQGNMVGDVDLGGGSDVLNNAGLITGEVDLGDGQNEVTNTGTITGIMTFGTGNDSYTAAGNGLVTDGVFGDDGNDTLQGGEADDLLNGGDDVDFIFGNSGEDILNGGNGNDFIFGGADDDIIIGGADNDVLRGNSGNDDLSGGGGADKIFGGAGDDEITGSGARDVLRGNGGADTFIYTAISDSTVANADRIRDFQSGEDLIDISEIETFTFVGSAAFSGTGAEVRFQTLSNGLRFEMDVDGDGAADMRVNMNNVSTMTEVDFIL